MLLPVPASKMIPSPGPQTRRMHLACGIITHCWPPPQALNFANLAQPLAAVSINGQALPRSGWNGWVWTPQVGAGLLWKFSAYEREGRERASCLEASVARCL